MSKNVGNLQDKDGNSLFPSVIETVTNDSGTALKFADGTMICYGQQSLSTTNYYHGMTGEWSYPAAFTATPIVYATPDNWTTHMVTAKVQPLRNFSRVMAFILNASMAWVDIEVTVNLLAIGRWK